MALAVIVTEPEVPGTRGHHKMGKLATIATECVAMGTLAILAIEPEAVGTQTEAIVPYI